jgi:peptide deformylase
MALKIIRYPSKYLRKIAQPVTAFDEALRVNVKSMIEMLEASHAWGLTATQIGLDARFFALKGESILCFINPEIIEKNDETVFQQDCISFPGVHISIPRANSIKLKYQDENGLWQENVFTEEMAYRIQHQIEFLDGVLFIDYLSKLKRDRLLKKYDKILKNPQACGDTSCGHDHSHDHDHTHDHHHHHHHD